MLSNKSFLTNYKVKILFEITCVFHILMVESLNIILLIMHMYINVFNTLCDLQ